MVYSSKSSHGDAGQDLVAGKVEKLLGWPCRLQGKDIGIDAEIEILDEHGRSTGDLIKVQIKAVEAIPKNGKPKVYVDEEHVNYWKTLCLPVLVICIDLSTETMLWQQVLPTRSYDSEGESKRVDFSVAEDILDASRKVELSRLGQSANSKSIAVQFDELGKAAAELGDGWMDFESIKHEEIRCDTVSQQMDALYEIQRHFPWRFGTDDIGFLEQVRNKVRRTRNEMGRVGAELTEGG